MLDCIIPAGGASSRMGSWKPLLPWLPTGEGSPRCVVEATVDAALASGCSVVLVGGYRGEELAALFSGRAGVEVVQNPAWERGMLGSIQRGMEALGPLPFFTIPADMPLVGPAVYTRLFDALAAGEAQGLPARTLFASFRGEAGHPVFIPAWLAPRIAALPPGERLRPFLLREEHLFVDCSDESVLVDLDDEAAYSAALARSSLRGKA
jgi:molybdenum cofactor cytidylyltransferase